MSGPSRPVRSLLTLLTFVLASCGGGGGSPSSPTSYPAVKGTYGAYSGTNVGYAQQRWIAPDGTVTTQQCQAVTSIPIQNGASFSGSVDRLPPCSSQATIVGAVAADGKIEFTLTQARWGTCTSVGSGGQYRGVVSLGSLLANGTTTVLCDDGRTMTIEEQITGSLPVPPPTPG
jgi:hypothetical protein